jgi:hypothetical protein
VHLLYDLLLIGKVLSCAAAAADWLKNKSGIGGLIRTSFLFAGSIGSEFVIVSLGLTCMIDRCFDSRMQLNVQLLSEGPSRNSTISSFGVAKVNFFSERTLPCIDSTLLRLVA